MQKYSDTVREVATERAHRARIACKAAGVIIDAAHTVLFNADNDATRSAVRITISAATETLKMAQLEVTKTQAKLDSLAP